MPPRAISAQAVRAILLASATATSIRGFLANMRANQDPSGAPPRRTAARTTDMAPMMSRRLISRCPIFDVRPNRVLPPVECWRGTSPSQAEKSRPYAK